MCFEISASANGKTYWNGANKIREYFCTNSITEYVLSSIVIENVPIATAIIKEFIHGLSPVTEERHLTAAVMYMHVKSVVAMKSTMMNKKSIRPRFEKAIEYLEIFESIKTCRGAEFPKISTVMIRNAATMAIPTK